MSQELVQIKATAEDRADTARKLLEEADDPSAVRVVTGGFVVPRGLAERTGLLEASVAATDDEAAATTAAQGGLVEQAEAEPGEQLLTPDRVEKPDLAAAAKASAQSTEGGNDPLAVGDASQAGTEAGLAAAAAANAPEDAADGSGGLVGTPAPSTVSGTVGDSNPTGTTSGDDAPAGEAEQAAAADAALKAEAEARAKADAEEKAQVEREAAEKAEHEAKKAPAKKAPAKRP